jgi:hypothetical protein
MAFHLWGGSLAMKYEPLGEHKKPTSLADKEGDKR